MQWITRLTLLLIGFFLGSLIPTSHAQYDPPRGMNRMEFVRMMFQAEEQDRQRQQAEREVDAKLFLKLKADKLNRLYTDVRDIWQVAVTEQQKQLEQQSGDILDIKQDVLVARLTQEMANKATEIAKINKVKR